MRDHERVKCQRAHYARVQCMHDRRAKHIILNIVGHVYIVIVKSI